MSDEYFDNDDLPVGGRCLQRISLVFMAPSSALVTQNCDLITLLRFSVAASFLERLERFELLNGFNPLT